jgi:hypothetical protein
MLSELGQPPNMRLKLTAPSCWGGHRFVEPYTVRRSLSAIR